MRAKPTNQSRRPLLPRRAKQVDENKLLASAHATPTQKGTLSQEKEKPKNLNDEINKLCKDKKKVKPIKLEKIFKIVKDTQSPKKSKEKSKKHKKKKSKQRSNEGKEEESKLTDIRDFMVHNPESKPKLPPLDVVMKDEQENIKPPQQQEKNPLALNGKLEVNKTLNEVTEDLQNEQQEVANNEEGDKPMEKPHEPTAAKSQENSRSNIDGTSQSGSAQVLETMLRIEVDFPQQRIVSLIDEYEEYLESNNLVDPKDEKRFTMNKQQQNSNEEGSAEEDNGGENQKFDPKEVGEIPVGTKNLGYYDVLKDMITRMELEGTLGRRREYGRTTKGGKINEERDEQYYYNLDDEFIDDNDLVNNESMNHVFSQTEVVDEEANFMANFTFCPMEELEKLGDDIIARKRKRLEDEQISDEKINDKMKQLEKAVHEGKDGTVNSIIQEIALKLTTSESDDEKSLNEYQKYREEILLKLQRIFKEKDKEKIEYMLELFVKRQNAKDEMNHLSDMCFRYVEMNKKKFQDLDTDEPEPKVPQEQENDAKKEEEKKESKKNEEVKENKEEEKTEPGKTEPKPEEPEVPQVELSEFVRSCLDDQAKQILGSVGKEIRKFLRYTNMYEVYKIHTGVKRVKLPDDMQDKFTGDLKADAKIFGKIQPRKITSNTVIKKIKDLMNLFPKKYYSKLQEEVEKALDYKLDS